MDKRKTIMAVALALVAVGADAQDFSKLQARGFGARNTQAVAKADSALRAQQNDSVPATGDTDPHFPGGDLMLEAYLKKKILHSDVNGKGTVVVSFIVEKNGIIRSAEIVRSAGNTLDTAAYNIVTGMPRWRPGLTDGQPADKPAQVTINFGKED